MPPSINDRKVLSEKENIPDGPPKPPRTAFMCFSDTKSKEMAEFMTSKKDIFQRVATLWRKLSSSERAYWDEEARNDKLRYSREKSSYSGPWNIPKRRAKKHPMAPRRPMSAFLKFSKTHRALIRQENPDVGNTDVSRLLGERWRNMSVEDKRVYVETEIVEREAYKRKMAQFKAQQARLDAASRTHHASIPTPRTVPQEGATRDYFSFRDTATQEYLPPREGMLQEYIPPREVIPQENRTKDYNALFRNNSRDSIYRTKSATAHQHLGNYSHYFQDNRSSYTGRHRHSVLQNRHSFAEAPSFDSFVDSIPEPMPALEYHPMDFDGKRHDENHHPHFG